MVKGLDRLIERNPVETSLFLNTSGTVMVIRTDRNYRVVDCNRSLVTALRLSEKPAGVFLGDILFPLDDTKFEETAVASKEAERPVPQVFRLGYSRVLFRCFIFNIDEGYLLFGERIESTDTDALNGMSLLNNELATMTRELGRKNRELEEANRRITELTKTDHLTGLANRRYFQERFREAMSLAVRKKNPLSLIMADLDFFKTVNDTYGHDSGDLVLKECAAVIRGECRQEDLAVRFGGEEFLVMLPQTTAEQAGVPAERIRERMEQLDILGDQYSITTSIGIAELEPSDTEDTLIKRADEALYRAKKEGRNRVVVW